VATRRSKIIITQLSSLNLSQKDLFACNMCRIYLRALYLSDITSGDGLEISEAALIGILDGTLWAYTYTQSTRRVSSRKPRGDPAENPVEHPSWTSRPSGPRGLDVRHRALCSQPCTANADAGGAIRTLVPVASLPRPPLERENVPTYDSWGKPRL